MLDEKELAEIRRVEGELRKLIDGEPDPIVVAILSDPWYEEIRADPQDYREEYLRYYNRVQLWRDGSDTNVGDEPEVQQDVSAPNRKPFSAEEKHSARRFGQEEDPSRATRALLRFLASKDAATVFFRREHLGNTLLPLGQVAEWIRKQGRRDEGSAESEVIHLHTGDTSDGARGAAATGSDTAHGAYIDYKYGVQPDGTEIVTNQPVLAGGVLEHLHSVATGDAFESLGWTCAEAVDFILAGSVPQPSTVDVVEVRKNIAVPALSRIVLSVDPASPPAHVAGEYRKARRRFKAPGRRMEQMGPRALAEARFGFEALLSVLEEIQERVEAGDLQKIASGINGALDEPRSDTEWLAAMKNLHEFFDVARIHRELKPLMPKKQVEESLAEPDNTSGADDDADPEISYNLRSLLKRKHFEAPLAKWRIEVREPSWDYPNASRFRDRCISAMERFIRPAYLDGFSGSRMT
ncbi:hypothetical protein ACFL51_00170 [Myxococcota bacterium]